MPPQSFNSDVFISYRWVDPDQLWVRGHLKPALEEAGLRVVLDVDDFVPGRDLILEMTRACSESRSMLCILSPEYFDGDRMVAFESLMARRSDPAGQHSRLIPMIVRPCTLPDWIRGLIPVDFTDKRRHLKEWRKLLRALEATRDASPPPPLDEAVLKTGLAPVRASESLFQAPRPPDVFVGRSLELARLEELLAQSNPIIIVRAGTGGSGKTALAAVAATRFRSRFPDGVHLRLPPLSHITGLAARIWTRWKPRSQG